jgi:hypothetical protein
MTVLMSASDASGGVARDGCANGRRSVGKMTWVRRGAGRQKLANARHVACGKMENGILLVKSGRAGGWNTRYDERATEGVSVDVTIGQRSGC